MVVSSPNLFSTLLISVSDSVPLVRSEARLGGSELSQESIPVVTLPPTRAISVEFGFKDGGRS